MRSLGPANSPRNVQGISKRDVEREVQRDVGSGSSSAASGPGWPSGTVSLWHGRCCGSRFEFPEPIEGGTLGDALSGRFPTDLSWQPRAACSEEWAMARQRRAGGGIDPLPSGRYRVRVVTVDGRRLSLGTFPTSRAAEVAYARAVADQVDGKQPEPVHAAAPLLADYAPPWVRTRLTVRGEPLRPRVRHLYENQLRLHIIPCMGSMRLTDITTPVVREWCATLRRPDGPGVSTAAKCYRLLRSILTTAVEDGLIAVNPCTIKGAGVERAEERPIPSVAQALDLADAVGPRLRCAVLLAAFVGLRKGELLGLRRCDVDLVRREISVVQQRQVDRHGQQLVGPPKTDAGVRSLAIPSSLVDELQVHLDAYAQVGGDGYVFTGERGGPLAAHVMHCAWAKARDDIGLPELHFHDLRHLAGTLAASTGAGTKELMYRLGHASQQAALRYQHATAERDRAIADALDSIISAEVGKPVQ